MLMLSGRGTGAHEESAAEAVDFDGTNDYLSRSSDLTGNADGKTFTFSAWVWNLSSAQTGTIYGSDYFYIQHSSTSFEVIGNNTGGVQILKLNINPVIGCFSSTWNHLLISINLENSSNRHVYINDVLQTDITWVYYYSNQTLDFTRASHYVGESLIGNIKYKGRLAHVFLAYEYIDLSVEANRRIFITSDRKPA